MNKILKGIFILSCVLVASGCSSSLKQQPTGFLADYSQLKESDEFENTYIYVAPSFNKTTIANINQIYVEPFEVWVKQTSEQELNRIDTQQLKKLHRYFHQQLSAALETNYQLVNSPTKGSLDIRGVFSGIKLASPEIKVTDFVPIRVILNTGNMAYLQVTDQKDLVSEVSIEMEFVFGEPKQRVVAMTATKALDVTVKDSEQGNMDAVKQILDIWIENFATKLHAAKLQR